MDSGVSHFNVLFIVGSEVTKSIHKPLVGEGGGGRPPKPQQLKNNNPQTATTVKKKSIKKNQNHPNGIDPEFFTYGRTECDGCEKGENSIALGRIQIESAICQADGVSRLPASRAALAWLTLMSSP